MKKILLMASLFIATLSQAQDRLVLELNDGTLYDWMLEDMPYFTTQDDRFIVICNEQLTEYPIKSILRVTRSGLNAASNTILDNSVLVNVTDKNIEVSHVSGNVSLFNMLGVCVKHANAVVGSVVFHQIPAGIYLVKTDDKSVKVVVK